MRAETMKVALVHDWLAGMRGAERCLEHLCDLFPRADIFTLFHIKGSVSETIESHRIVTSFIDSLPFVESYYRYTLPIMPLAVESFRFDEYDLVISGSSCVAKGVIVPNGVPNISYVYSPMRYAWDLSSMYFGSAGGHGGLYHWTVSSFLHPLRVWDTASWTRPDRIAVISEYISRRLGKAARRKANVIYPPVDTAYFSRGLKEEKRDYALLVTAFEPNRRPELAIDACVRAGVPLKVVGSLGRNVDEIKRRGGKQVEFLGTVHQERLRALYGEALCLVVPGIEDFGIAPVEAMAAGTPVIVSSDGGAKETLGSAQEQLGLVVRDATDEKWASAIREVCDGWGKNKWDRKVISDHAGQFSQEVFSKNFLAFVESSMGSSSQDR
jgi:glycosyltransferase involved in cell wall biosynthesis